MSYEEWKWCNSLVWRSPTWNTFLLTQLHFSLHIYWKVINTRKLPKYWLETVKKWALGGVGAAERNSECNRGRCAGDPPPKCPPPAPRDPPVSPSATRAAPWTSDARCSRGASLVAPGTPQGMRPKSGPLPKCPTWVLGVNKFDPLPKVCLGYFKKS